MIRKIGEPGIGQALIAAALIEQVPSPLQRAAHSDEWAPELLLYLLIGRDKDVREDQLLAIAETLGAESESQVRDLLNIQPDLPRTLRLPLMELAFPAIRRRPEDELVEFMRLVERLIEADDRVEVFEYVLARLLNREIEQAMNPSRKSPGGGKKLPARAESAADLIAIVALHGHPDDPDAARKAVAQALEGVDGIRERDAESLRETWRQRLDQIFADLRALNMDARGRLVEILMRCARHDGEVNVAEYELLRLVAGMLRVPLPAGGGEGA
ncbi:MAG: peptidase M48, partial [Candidatus Wenzhouxiangella sp. M2_3B_020]